ncbi:MAG: CoA-binding protein [Actinobacteria bacterium]|mgnify:FL=1|jgi:Predicted CoA-binding protein|nr:CoA-binding protein [Actinomycetota bacterium]
MSVTPSLHQNDPDVVRALLMDPGVWVVVGLSTNEERPAHSVARWLKYEQGRTIIPVHPKAERVFGETAYASLADIPDQFIKVVDCFVSSEHVGAVVDEAIAHKERLHIDAIWMQKGVVDEAAAARAEEAGLEVVMDTCPKIEWRAMSADGQIR